MAVRQVTMVARAKILAKDMAAVQQHPNTPARVKMRVKARVAVRQVTMVARVKILAKDMAAVRFLSIPSTCHKVILYIAENFRVPNL